MTTPTNRAMRRTPLALGCVRGDGGHSRRAGGVRCGRSSIGGGATTADWIQTRSPEVTPFTSFDGRGSGSTIGPDGRSTSLMAMLVGCDASIVAPAR